MDLLEGPTLLEPEDSGHFIFPSKRIAVCHRHDYFEFYNTHREFV